MRKIGKDRKPGKLQGTKGCTQEELGLAMLKYMRRQPLELTQPMLLNVVVTRRRRSEECN